MKRISAGQDVTPDRGSTPWSRRLTGVYILLSVFSAFILLDGSLPLRSEACVVSNATEMRVNISGSSTSRKVYTHWALVTFKNGMRFQTKASAGLFPRGDTVDVEMTRFRKEVVRYRNRSGRTIAWYEVEGSKPEYLLYAAGTMLCGLLLLWPGWRAETRWLLNAILAILLVAWMVTLFGTGMMKSFY